MNVCSRAALVNAFNTELQPDRFKDYGPNGLQVEGRPEIARVVSGVTASKALIEAALDLKADALVVHHGLFWRGQEGRVTGWMRQRLGLLLAHDVNLLAYHLPLDAHPTLGNNAQLGQLMGWQAQGRCGDQDLVWLGQCLPQTSAHLAQAIELRLNRSVTLVDAGADAIKNIAWCTGGAQGYFEAAIAAGAQAYVTGEISEPQAHYAREMGVSYLAVGHHASERYGVAAVSARVCEGLGLIHTFVDIPNPA